MSKPKSKPGKRLSDFRWYIIGCAMLFMAAVLIVSAIILDLLLSGKDYFLS